MSHDSWDKLQHPQKPWVLDKHWKKMDQKKKSILTVCTSMETVVLFVYLLISVPKMLIFRKKKIIGNDYGTLNQAQILFK